MSTKPSLRRRVGVFGWGLVAPKSPNVNRFAENLDHSESWLSPFNGFGPDNFLVGEPEFDFVEYATWINERFSPNRFSQLQEKMDLSTLYAVGAFIQALDQNPGLEETLSVLGEETHVYVGTGLGSLPTISSAALALYHAQRRWDRFWAHPDRNSVFREYLEGRTSLSDVPRDPATVSELDREEAEGVWWRYWAECSPDLKLFLEETREIDALRPGGDIEKGKLRVIRQKRKRHGQLLKRWGSPEPPWNQVSANLIWNIPNTPAAQISMLGRITGMTFAPAAACSTFGVALKLGLEAIWNGQAKAVVVGAADPPPTPLTVGAFYRARVIAADGDVSKPLADLRGTHISGGSVIWVIGDLDYLRGKGFQPLGMEPLGVGVTADASHIITPSKEGPQGAIEQASKLAGVGPSQIGHWDLHATATPGDFAEVQNLSEMLSKDVLVTARKGTFGHGMSAGGGWELTAQYLGFQKKRLFPTPLAAEELNRQIGLLHSKFVFQQGCDISDSVAGKLSMGIGGINACVLSKPLKD